MLGTWNMDFEIVEHFLKRRAKRLKFFCYLKISKKKSGKHSVWKWKQYRIFHLNNNNFHAKMIHDLSCKWDFFGQVSNTVKIKAAKKKIVAIPRAQLKKGSKTLRNLPSIWPGFHAVFFWPKLECVRRLAFLSVFCQFAIWCIEQSIHYDLKKRSKIK